MRSQSHDEELTLDLLQQLVGAQALPALPPGSTALSELGIESVGHLRLMIICAERCRIDLENVADLPDYRLTTVADAVGVVRAIRAASLQSGATPR